MTTATPPCVYDNFKKEKDVSPVDDLIVTKHVKLKWSRYKSGVAQRVGRSIALLFHDRGTRRRWVVSSTSRPQCTPGKYPVPILQEASGTLGRSGLAENLVPTEIRPRTVQPVAQSLYRLSYPVNTETCSELENATNYSRNIVVCDWEYRASVTYFRLLQKQ